MSFDPKVIEALARLRHAANGIVGLTSPLARDLNTLDNAGVFAALDEQADYAAAEDILADSARRDLEKALDYSLAPGTVPPLDPAEWGDTTREDMARHQGLLVEPKCTPLDEPLVGSQAEVYRRLLGGTTGGGKSVELGYTPYPSDPDPR
jgi:hypothetical protein